MPPKNDKIEKADQISDAAKVLDSRKDRSNDLADEELEKEYLESVRKESAKGRTLTSLSGGLLLAAGTTLLNPLLAVPAAIVGIGAGYKMYKERERSSVAKAEKMLTLGDQEHGVGGSNHGTAETADSASSTASSRPPLRRLIFLVRWASLQIATDLDNGDIKPSRLEKVYDETILSFSSWVQRIYYIRTGEKSKSKREQETKLVKLHLSPMVRWLQSSPSNEVFMMVNHEFSKWAVSRVLENTSNNNTSPMSASDSARILKRCRSVFPLIIEVSHLFNLQNDETRFGQLVVWISKFLRQPNICGWLAESHVHAGHDTALMHNNLQHPMGPSISLGTPTVSPGHQNSSDEKRSDAGDDIEFPPLGVEQEMEEDEFFSASEGEDEKKDKKSNKNGAFERMVESSVGMSNSAVSTGFKSNEEVADSVLFPKGDTSIEGPTSLNNCWTELDGSQIFVRGPTYLVDRVKVKSEKNMLEMLCFDLFYTDAAIPCVSTNKHCKAYWLLENDPNLFTFTINWRLHPMQAAVTYGIRKDKCDWILRKSECPERLLLERFLGYGDELLDLEKRKEITNFRNNCIKVIPQVTDGPWLVKKAVGQTPAIIGKKLKVDYHDRPGKFFECEYDVLSTAAARSTIGLIVSAAKRLVIDVGIVLEAKEFDELPERMLGGFRIHYPDLSTCRRVVTLGETTDDGDDSD